MPVYRRRSAIRHIGDTVRVDIEDYQHRFSLVLHHDRSRVTGVEGNPIRTPWVICPGATSMLGRFVGLELDASPFAMMRKVELAQQCTHMADMACLAASGVARGHSSRTYDVVIDLTPLGEPDRRNLRIFRDDTPLFQWTLDNNVIQAPEHLTGLEAFRAGRWASERASDASELEAIFVAHRTVMVANGLRYPDIEVFNHAANSKVGRNACYTMQEVRIDGADRNPGSIRNFGSQSDLLSTIDG